MFGLLVYFNLCCLYTAKNVVRWLAVFVRNATLNKITKIKV